MIAGRWWRSYIFTRKGKEGRANMMIERGHRIGGQPRARLQGRNTVLVLYLRRFLGKISFFFVSRMCFIVPEERIVWLVVLYLQLNGWGTCGPVQ